MTRTLVLVHGAWAGGSSWSRIQAGLEKRGIRSHAPDLPGHGSSKLPLGDLYDDARFLREFSERLEGELVLVGHSYGGAVISEAALSLGNVAHLVYVTGFCLEEGEAFLPLRRSISSDMEMAEATRRPGGGDEVVVDPEAALNVFYGATPDRIAAEAVAQLGPQLVATFSQPVSGAPWRSLPSTYVRCSEDRAIPVAVQDVMAARCGTVITIATDHSPFLSAVPELLDVLVPVATA